MGDAFPAVTAVRVKDALDAVGNVVMNLVLAIRVASAVTLIAAVLVLGGALAAGHRHRVYDAVILKTLGATRRQLITAYALEYLLLGLATVLFGVAAGSLAAWGVVANVMSVRRRLAGALADCGGSASPMARPEQARLSLGNCSGPPRRFQLASASEKAATRVVNTMVD